MTIKRQGLLVGYKAYEKDGVTKHKYSVLCGSRGEVWFLHGDCTLITVIQSEQTLKELKPQFVSVDETVINNGSQSVLKYSNVLASWEVE